jgi:putative ABC transport system permease protein
MRWWDEMKYLVRKLNRKRADQELEEEIRTHLELETQEKIEAGLSPEEARYAAQRAFGGVALAKEKSRAIWGFGLLETLWQDLRYGSRMLLKHLGFTVVAVLTLALGIGMNTALFTIFYAFVIRPLPVKDPESLVRVDRTGPDGSHGECCLSLPDYLYYRDHNQVFSNLIGYLGAFPLTMSGGDAASGIMEGDAEIIHVALVSGNYFTALGGGAILGRTFTPDEDRTPGTNPVLVLSYHFWQRRFGGDPAIVGKSLKIHRHQFTIIGVAARDFAGVWPQVPDAWGPLMMQDRILPFLDFPSRNSTFLRVMGRLKPGVTFAQAQAEMAVLASQIAQAYPASNEKIGVTLVKALSFSELGGKCPTK